MLFFILWSVSSPRTVQELWALRMWVFLAPEPDSWGSRRMAHQLAILLWGHLGSRRAGSRGGALPPAAWGTPSWVFFNTIGFLPAVEEKKGACSVPLHFPAFMMTSRKRRSLGASHCLKKLFPNCEFVLIAAQYWNTEAFWIPNMKSQWKLAKGMLLSL